jgi:nitrogen fixation protein FixH
MIAVTSQGWRRFPRYMIGAMLAVVVVNAVFISAAIHTFPGAASNDDFDTSNRYNTVLDAAAAQDALGWTERAIAEHGQTMLDLADREGRPLSGVLIECIAERPLGTDAAKPMMFHEVSPGHYVASAVADLGGQWDLKLHLRLDRHEAWVTRRIVVK